MRVVTVLFFSSLITLYSFTNKAGYVCPPCGCASDGKIFEKPGNCPSCSMALLNKDNKSEGLMYTNLDPDEVCDLQSRIPDVLFLDVRTEREFNRSPLGRIKNAKHIHVEDLKRRVGELDQYKDKEIIVYCLVGIRSARASEFLADKGFTNVNNMLGGMELWNNRSTQEISCKSTLLEKN